MNHTKGPWFVQIKSSVTGGSVGSYKYLSIEDDTGPILIVDEQSKVVATIVHREGKGKGFSETACNARLVGHAPDIFAKAEGLVRDLRAGQDPEVSLRALEALLKNIQGVVSST
jgi:hypothetical protein